MRIRIRTSSGGRIDCEQYTTDSGATWADITAAVVADVLRTPNGYITVRDELTGQWRAVRHSAVESIGPAGELSEVIETEVERRIRRVLAERLPERVRAAVN